MPIIFQKTWAQNSSTIGNNNFDVHTNASKPYGLIYGEWTAKWWQWVYSVPSVNPSYDDSWRYCSEGQTRLVYFLTSSYKHSVDRNPFLRHWVLMISFQGHSIELQSIKRVRT